MKPSSSPSLLEAPLQALMNSHQHTLTQCTVLLTLVKHIEGGSCTVETQSTARELLHYFDTAVYESQVIEEQNLFPALIESMAGSDAVCLRGITQGLSDRLHALDRHWRHRLRSPLMSIAEGKTVELSATDARTFADDYAVYVECCDEELIPMAERLLTDPEIASLGRIMHGHSNT